MNIAVVKKFSMRRTEFLQRRRPDLAILRAFLLECGHTVTFEDPVGDYFQERGSRSISAYPEYSDFQALSQFELRDWTKYELILCYELGSVQILGMLGFDVWWFSHMLWNSPSNAEARKIKAFVAWAYGVICTSSEVFGMMQDVDVKAVYAPRPYRPTVDVDAAHGTNVVWVGRWSFGQQKRFDRLVRVAEVMPDVLFDAYLSDTAPSVAFPINIRVHVGEVAAPALAIAGAFLSTSEYEVAPITFNEAGFAGTPIIAWDIFGAHVFGDTVRVVENEAQAQLALRSALLESRDDMEQRKKFFMRNLARKPTASAVGGIAAPFFQQEVDFF